MRILLAEDDLRLAALVLRGLESEGHVVDVAGDGERALARAAAVEPDVAILDVALPVVDGFEVCRRLRGDGRWLPVLLLAGRNDAAGRLRALDVGADDWLARPFAYADLAVRVRALAHGSGQRRPAMLEVGDLRLDPSTLSAFRGKTRIRLSPKECALLEAMMQRPGEVVSRARLLEHAWEVGYDNRSNVVDVYIRYLRQKVDRPFARASIETVRGAGYRFSAT